MGENPVFKYGTNNPLKYGLGAFTQTYQQKFKI